MPIKQMEVHVATGHKPTGSKGERYNHLKQWSRGKPTKITLISPSLHRFMWLYLLPGSSPIVATASTLEYQFMLYWLGKCFIAREGGSRTLSPRPITQNTLFYGDNLYVLREHIPSESVDLIYLDPPFNSSRNYNVLFRDEHGTESQAQNWNCIQDK